MPVKEQEKPLRVFQGNRMLFISKNIKLEQPGSHRKSWALQGHRVTPRRNRQLDRT